MLAAARLHRSRRRAHSGRSLLEGPHLLDEAVQAGIEVHEVFGLAGDERSQRRAEEGGGVWIPVDDRILARLASTAEPQSPVAVFAVPDWAIPDEGHVLVAWGVGDPGNLGTLIRSAAAFGVGVAVGPGTADPWSPKVLRAAAGGHFHTTIGRCGDLEALSALQRPLVATVVSGGEDPATLSDGGDLVLLIGDEAAGLAAELVEAADRRVTIAMPGGTESLNAGVAGSILAYELSRRRGGSHPTGH